MKKAFLLVHDIFTLFTHEAKTILLIVIFLSLSIGISFSMLAYCSSQMGFLEEIAYDKATYDFYYYVPTPEEYAQDSNTLTAIETFDTMFFTDKLPKVRGSYDELTFRTFYEYDTSHYDDDGGKAFWWRPYFKTDFALYKDSSKELLEGRWFSEVDDLVAIVSTKDFPETSIGDFIEIFDQKIEVIGILENDNYLPYNLMLELSDKERGFTPDVVGNCIFLNPLSDKQIEDISTYSLISITCKYDIRMATYISNILLILTLVMGIFLVIMLNMLNLFKHIINKSKYRFMVIKMCGGGKILVFLGLYLVPLSITGVSFLIGLLLHLSFINSILIDTLKYPPLRALDYVLTFLLTLFFAFVVLLPTVRKVAKAQPASAELWR